MYIKTRKIRFNSSLFLLLLVWILLNIRFVIYSLRSREKTKLAALLRTTNTTNKLTYPPSPSHPAATTTYYYYFEMSLMNLTTDIQKVATVLNSAFVNSPSNLYCVKKIFNIDLKENFSEHRNLAIMFYYTSMYLDLGGELSESNDFNAVALVCPPGVHIDFAETRDDTFNKIWYRDLDDTFTSQVGGNPFYYICLVGRNFDEEKKKGSVTNIFNHYKKMADMQGVPIILESISDASTRIYEHYGFKSIHRFRYGQGEVDTFGNPDPNGEGFEADVMVYFNDFDKLPEYRSKKINAADLPKVDPKTYAYIDKNPVQELDTEISSKDNICLSAAATAANSATTY